LVLDLFCGGGGASMGYHLAGHQVVGVDLIPQPNYPFTLVTGDALSVARRLVRELRPAFIHASPPCQAASATRAFRNRPGGVRTAEPVNLIPATRELLDEIGIPYVIENVAYKAAGMRTDLTLCGQMFGLGVYRHRQFEFGCGAPIPGQPAHSRHVGLCARNGYLPTPERPMMTITGRNGHHSKAWVRKASEVMRTPWLSTDLNAVCESIPPAYTRYIGMSLRGEAQ